jgi:Amt family ammonium transporter
VVSGALGTTGLVLAGEVASEAWLETGVVWWLGDALGILIVTPVIAQWHAWRALDRTRKASLAVLALLLGATGATIAVFGGERASNLFFLLLPFVVWAALRFDGPGATATVAVLALIVLGMRALSGDSQPFTDAVRIAFVGASAFTGLLVSAVVSMERRARIALEWRVQHDPLTGLMNRGALDEELTARIARLPQGGQLGLLYLDLDQFKLVNDTCGHEVGDRLLAELAARLRVVVPEPRTLARLGGDEFAVLVEGDADDALTRAELIRAEIVEFRFAVGDLSFGLATSVGVTFASAGDTPASALARADIACNVAKEHGRNRIHVYRPDDVEMMQHHGEMEWVSQLRRALDEGRFLLYGQRMVRIGDRAGPLDFHEVLLRLRDGTRVVGPQEFLTVAQRYGQLPTIDRWVIEQSFRLLGERKNTNLSLSINVSGSTLELPDFAAFVEELERRHGVDPRRVCMEVTESVAFDRLSRAVGHMRQLRTRGYRFALDDFGSGVASFGYLQQLPVDLVKIDGRFVRDLGKDASAALIVESLAKLARLKSLECVAEWVESREALEELGRLGVDYAQGLYIERPQPLAA